jgi:F0F1-type ATP synthase membrane subunit a
MLGILAADPMEHVLPHPIFGDHLTWFTNQSLMAGVAAILMLLIFPRLFAKPDSSAPTGAKNFFESILEFLRIEVFRPSLKEHTDKFTPFLWTVFFFILFSNLLGCIPIGEFVGLITLGHLQHIGGTATGSIATTATLAFCAFLFIHFNGIDTVARSLMDGTYGKHGHGDGHDSHDGDFHKSAYDLEHPRGEGIVADAPGNLHALTHPVEHYKDGQTPGQKTDLETMALQLHSKTLEAMTPGKAILLAIPLYLWNFAPHPFRPKEGESTAKWFLDVPLFGVLLVLELIGAVIKPFSLCMRLFANMVAGHAVLAVLISLIVAAPTILGQLSIGIPAGLMDLGVQALELFVALLQAYIFTFLTTLFLASAVAPEH